MSYQDFEDFFPYLIRILFAIYSFLFANIIKIILYLIIINFIISQIFYMTDFLFFYPNFQINYLLNILFIIENFSILFIVQ